MLETTEAEIPAAALAQVAWWPGEDDAAARALTAAGLPAPPGPRRCARRGDALALDAGPGRAWLLGPAGTVDTVARAVGAEVGTVLDLSAARVRLSLDGARAGWILGKGTAVDLRADAFPDGVCAMTALHGIPVTLWREAGRFDLLAPTTYADALRGRLAEAMRPDGAVT